LDFGRELRDAGCESDESEYSFEEEVEIFKKESLMS